MVQNIEQGSPLNLWKSCILEPKLSTQCTTQSPPPLKKVVVLSLCLSLCWSLWLSLWFYLWVSVWFKFWSYLWLSSLSLLSEQNSPFLTVGSILLSASLNDQNQGISIRTKFYTNFICLDPVYRNSGTWIYFLNFSSQDNKVKLLQPENRPNSS